MGIIKERLTSYNEYFDKQFLADTGLAKKLTVWFNVMYITYFEFKKLQKRQDLFINNCN